MTLDTFMSILDDTNLAHLGFSFGTKRVPAHFHITEVAKTTKDFVDCGGDRRSMTTCVLQTYVANDIDHRLSPKKLLKILEKARELNLDPKTEVEVEVQGKTIETYSVSGSIGDSEQLVFDLETKHTDCLAKDKCGLDVLPTVDSTCCEGTSDCC